MSDKTAGVVSAAELSRLLIRLALPSPAADDPERIERIRQIEELKAALAAAQAREVAAFADSQRDVQLAAGGSELRVARVDSSIAGEVALARRCSPLQARRYVGWARILTRELPHTFAALHEGRTTEWRALLVARETAWLGKEHRVQVDHELADRLEHLGDLDTERAAKKIAYRLDPAGAVAKLRHAQTERRVTLRPAPDTMTYLTGLLPIPQGVAAYTALEREADRRIAAGDPRGRGQIMADTLVERVTGQTTAADVPVEVQLVITDTALLTKPGAPGRAEPAILTGHGPIPAPVARELVLGGAAPVWLRRLYTQPGTGELIAMDSRRRCFTPAQRRFITLRDQTCRTPWCDAPIRHTDHIRAHQHGGSTSVQNGQGYCQACNHTKQAAGWHTTVVPLPGGHTVEITTPSGHRYRSRAPDPPGARPESPLERHFREQLEKLIYAA